MQYGSMLSSAIRTARVLAVTLVSALAFSTSATVTTQTALPVVPFSSVELRNGGRAVLRYGPTQRVTIRKGSPDCTWVTVADGSRLVIDRVEGQCPDRYELEIEIVSADITRVSVAEGGMLSSLGNFPPQAELDATVHSGGTIDIRSMAVDRLTASVEQGGRIFAKPRIALSATVANGGAITYWGDARVERSVRNGGVVTKGAAAEADKPLAELNSPLESLPPIPAVRPIQPLRAPDGRSPTSASLKR
jgi:hypothetical protein